MAAGNFDNCLPIILRFEGGKSNDPQDPGGRTNRGVTQRTYNAYRSAKGQATADVYAIASSEVADCYRRGYWDAVKGDALRPGEDLVVFDLAVNSGPEKALSVWRGESGTTLEGSIRGICSNRLAFMQSLRTWPHFGQGWARRVAQVQQYGLAMAAGKVPSTPIKVKPGPAGGGVIVAGGAAAAALSWFGAHWLIAAITAAVAVLFGIHLWLAINKAQKMAASPAVEPTKPGVPVQPPDALESALVKVAAAKEALAAAIARALLERDAVVTRNSASQAKVAAAEARLAAMGVEIVARSPAPNEALP